METYRPVLLVGNFLSDSLGTRTVGEDLAVRLSASGWPVLTTSAKFRRTSRLLDMVNTVWDRRHDYAVAQVDVYSGPAFLWAEAVCWTLRRACKPYILTLHGGNLPAFARQWPRRVHRLLRSATAVTTPSRYLLEELKRFRCDMWLIPNPLELSDYGFKLRSYPEPRLIWLRAFHEIYNPSLAARVMALLVADFPEIQLIMVGPDKGDGSLQATRQVALELSVADRITLLGRVPRAAVSGWMNQGDIFINTTNYDNAPVSVLEAMACGLCVVSTNVGGIPYLLQHEHDALLVPPNELEAMAAAVSRVLTDPGLAEQLSRNARRKAEQFDWSLILPQWGKLLTSIAQASQL